jgi:hypothetical protein
MGTKVIIGPDTSKNVIHNIYPDGLDIPQNMMNENVGGKLKKCKHVYEYVNAPICPYCGRDTHEPDHELNARLIRENYTNGNHEKHLCSDCGGTIRGWWDI